MDWKDIEAWAFGFFAVGVIYGGFYLLERLFAKAKQTKPVQQAIKQAAAVVNPPAVFPFEFIEIPGGEAVAAFERAKTEGKGIPLLIGGGALDRQGLADMMKYRKPSTQDYLRMATEKPNPFDSKAKPKVEGAVPLPGALDEPPFLVRAHPEGFKSVVTLATIPAKSSADIPAFLKLGGWNGIAEAEVFVALLRKWQRDYGAELVAISMDAMDVRITRLPANKTEAMALAREHKRFCSSEITLAEMADELMHAKWWHFYWD
jgi:Domain of unknown function (DUF4253)